MVMTPTYCRTTAFEAFAAELPELATTRGLFRVAFAVSLHERPEASLTEAEETIVGITAAVQNRVHSSSREALLAHLHDILFEVYGLHGNVKDYYSPANSYLGDVLQTRRGLPISLVLIYKAVAEPLGVHVYGLNSPGHFLAEIQSGQGEGAGMIIDPFFRGGLLTREEAAERIRLATGRELPTSPDLFRRATHRQWLARMLLNLQAAFLAAGQERNQLAMLELEALLNDQVSSIGH